MYVVDVLKLVNQLCEFYNTPMTNKEILHRMEKFLDVRGVGYTEEQVAAAIYEGLDPYDTSLDSLAEVAARTQYFFPQPPELISIQEIEEGGRY